MKKTLMTLGMMILVVLLFVGCGDNNKGPFGYEYENGQLIVTSANKPAKGMVKYTTTDASNITRTVYEMDLDKGVPTGKITVYDENGTPFIEVDAKKADIGGYPFSYTGTMIIDGGDIKVEGDFKIESTEEFFNIFETFGQNLKNKNAVYTYFMTRFIINGTVGNGINRIEYKDGYKASVFREDNYVKYEEHYNSNGNKDGHWVQTYKGGLDKPLLKAGDIIEEHYYDNGIEVFPDEKYAKVYDDMHGNYTYYCAPNNNNQVRIVGGVSWVRIETINPDGGIKALLDKDDDGILRVQILRIFDINNNDITPKDITIDDYREWLEVLELDKLYPEFKFDFTQIHSLIRPYGLYDGGAKLL